MKDFIKKWYGDFLLWSATIFSACLWSYVGATEYLHQEGAPEWFMVGIAVAASFIWTLFFSSTEIGGWIIGDSGLRAMAMVVFIVIIVFRNQIPWGEPVGWISDHLPWNIEETLAAAEPEPPPPPAAEVANTKPTVFRYITGLNEDGRDISLMGEEMYEVRGVTAQYGGDLGYLDQLVLDNGTGYILASECLPRAGISTDWITLLGERCGGGRVEARCVKRNADYCQPPKPATP